MRDPVVDIAQGPGAEAVETLTAGAARGDQAGAEENAQVLGNGWARHGKGSGYPPHGQFAAAEQIEHAAPGWVADGGEDVGREAAWAAAGWMHG